MSASDSRIRRLDEWDTYRRLLQRVRPYTRRLVAGFLFGLLYAASNGALVWAIRGGTREVFNPGTASAAAFVLVVVALPVIALLRGAADFLATYCFRWLGHRVVMDLRNAMFSHIHGLSMSYFCRSRTGEIVSRVSSDTSMVERAVSTIIADLAKEPLTLVSMVVWLFLIDVRLTLVSLVVFPVCLVPIAVFGRRVRRFAREAQERTADVLSILQESLAGARIVKAFGMEHYEIARFAAQTKAVFGRIMRVEKASAIAEPVIVFVATAGIVLVLVYVRSVRMSVENFFAFAAALFMMYEPVKKLSKIHIQIQQSSGAADRIFELLDTPPEIRDAPGALEFADPVREIAFENVSFAYDAEPVLREITLRVRAGERVAFVGSSGAGKTTLVNLIPRFHDVSAGSLKLNGVDVRRISLRSLRRQIGLVSQETFLFNDTVASNIRYGSEDAPQERVVEAAVRAHAHEFITSLPEGYETVVGERGLRLSGGQCQRLAIARALLRNPPILILDEATSALDTESERVVQAAIEELMMGRTVLAIAHRLSTIASCDRILVLSGGRIVEQGTHQDLLARSGIYRRLYDLQFHDAEREPAETRE